MSKKRIPIRKIGRVLHRHLQLSARGKAAFTRSGEALDEAMSLGVPLGVPITLPGGKVVTVKDLFAEKNTAFSAKLFQRYKVEEVKPMPTRPRKSQEVSDD